MNVRTLQAVLSKLDPDAEVVIIDGDNYAQELRVGVGSMQPSVTGRDKYVRGIEKITTVGFEPGDDLGEKLSMDLSEDAIDEINANCNYEGVGEFHDGTWGHPPAVEEEVSMVRVDAHLELTYLGAGFTEEMTVINAGSRLRDGTCIGVVLEGGGADRYTCNILPSGMVHFEMGMTAMATPSN